MTAQQVVIFVLLLFFLVGIAWLVRDLCIRGNAAVGLALAPILTAASFVFLLYAAAVLELGITVDDLKELLKGGQA